MLRENANRAQCKLALPLIKDNAPQYREGVGCFFLSRTYKPSGLAGNRAKNIRPHTCILEALRRP